MSRKKRGEGPLTLKKNSVQNWCEQKCRPSAFTLHGNKAKQWKFPYLFCFYVNVMYIGENITMMNVLITTNFVFKSYKYKKTSKMLP